MSSKILVKKRDGRLEEVNPDKIHQVLEWACEDLPNVSISEIELNANLQFYNKISTAAIHELLIKSSAQLISEDTPNYQYVAARLINYQLRKEIYNSYEPPNLYEWWKKIVALQYYDPELESSYSASDWEILNSYINHDRDYMLAYAGMEQLRNKYLVRNRVTKQLYETPQIAFMLIAMTIFQRYDPQIRLKWVKDLYDAISTFDISFPTPIMAGVRTPQRQFSSCVLIDCDDSLESINATSSAIVKYVAQKAGIGINGGRIRAFESPVRKGDTTHTGVIPFWKYFLSATNSVSQGAIRTGAATLYYPIWHLEVEDLLVLKNSTGTEETRIRDMDFGVQVNKLMYERLLAGDNITLFCPNDVPDLYEAFFSNQEKFTELYIKYEKSTKIRKKSVPALDLFQTFLQERKDTGRIYLMNVDNCNEQGPFLPELAPIKQSNLCTEIALPNKPLTNVLDEEGQIALCTLAAVNWGKINKTKDFEKPCTLLIRALNEVLDYQDYPVPAAKTHTDLYRPLGVGIINFAYWMTKTGNSYKDPNLESIHEFTEAWSYYLIKASADLAAEQQRSFSGFINTKWSKGLLTVDTYKKAVDELVSVEFKMPWEELRTQILETGLLNSTVTALMPSETSSTVSNSTNSIEQPRALVSTKISKDLPIKQVVPGIHKYKNKYELLWDDKYTEGYLQICAVLQKFIDQAISVNTSYNPQLYPEAELPASELMRHMLLHYKWGGKTLYYFNTNDAAGEIDLDEQCEGCVI